MISTASEIIIINNLMLHMALSGILIVGALSIALFLVLWDTLPDCKPPSWWKY